MAAAAELLVKFSKLPGVTYTGVEDWSDKLHFKVTVVMLLVSCTIITVKTYILSPVACYVPNEIGAHTGQEQYVNNYCWTEGTFAVPLSEFNVDNTEPNPWAKYEPHRIIYYQWVPFVLGLQAICFYLSQVAWEILGRYNAGIDIQHLVRTANDAVQADGERHEKLVDHVTTMIAQLLAQEKKKKKFTAGVVPRAYSMFRASAIVFLIVACWTKVGVVQATNHSCASDQSNLKLSHDSEQSENFIPIMVPPEVSKCTWKVELPRDMMLILQGFDAAAPFNRSQKQSAQSGNSRSQWISYHLSESSTGCSSQETEGFISSADVFRVLPLTNGNTLTVTYERDANYSGNLPPGLTIQLMHKDFCSSEVVNFNKRCYKKSEISRNITDELRFINGNSQIVQLASFNSTAAIRQFLEINKRKIVGTGEQQRLKVPLNLTWPVRIGLFYDNKSKRVSYLFRNASDDQCHLEEFKDMATTNFSVLSNLSRTCGSLRVDAQSGREVLEFMDCDESLPALISFAETPTLRCYDCSKPVDIWLQDLHKTDAGEGYSNLIDYLFLIAGGTALCFVAAISMLLFTRYRGSRQCGVQQSCSKKPKESTKNDCEDGYSAKQPLNE